MTQRKKLIILIGGLMLVIALGVGFLKFWPGFHAFEESNQAILAITITRSGEEAVGEITVDGDCPDETLSSSEGVFSCELQSNNSNLSLRNLAFYDFTNDIVYDIPLSTSPSTEGTEFVLKPYERLQLVVTIEADTDALLVQRQDSETGELTPFPPPPTYQDNEP